MNAVESLNSKILDVIKKCIGKQVILYGYGKSGIFIEWLCSHVYGKKFTLVIDDKKVIPGISLPVTEQLPGYAEQTVGTAFILIGQGYPNRHIRKKCWTIIL